MRRLKRVTGPEDHLRAFYCTKFRGAMDLKEKLAAAYLDAIHEIRLANLDGSADSMAEFQAKIVQLRNRILVDLLDDDPVVTLFAMVDLASCFARDFGLPKEWMTMMFEMSFDSKSETSGKVMCFADLTEGEWEL